MTTATRVVAPGPDGHSVRTPAGEVLHPPEDWILLLPGDATLTRRVKAAGPTWTVQEKVGRKTFSRGVWAPRAVVDQVRTDLAAERATPQYQQRREAGVRQRQREQADYVEEFHRAVLDFLAFDARYADLVGRPSSLDGSLKLQALPSLALREWPLPNLAELPGKGHERADRGMGAGAANWGKPHRSAHAAPARKAFLWRVLRAGTVATDRTTHFPRKV